MENTPQMKKQYRFLKFHFHNFKSLYRKKLNIEDGSTLQKYISIKYASFADENFVISKNNIILLC